MKKNSIIYLIIIFSSLVRAQNASTDENYTQSTTYKNPFLPSSLHLVNEDDKLEIIKTDFQNLENYKENIKGDDCFFCIGTTKKNSPDKDEYKRVELDIPKKIAQIAKLNLVKSFLLLMCVNYH